jgi:hypothetical protein
LTLITKCARHMDKCVRLIEMPLPINVTVLNPNNSGYNSDNLDEHPHHRTSTSPPLQGSQSSSTTSVKKPSYSGAKANKVPSLRGTPPLNEPYKSPLFSIEEYTKWCRKQIQNNPNSPLEKSCMRILGNLKLKGGRRTRKRRRRS